MALAVHLFTIRELRDDENTFDTPEHQITATQPGPRIFIGRNSGSQDGIPIVPMQDQDGESQSHVSRVAALIQIRGNQVFLVNYSTAHSLQVFRWPDVNRVYKVPFRSEGSPQPEYQLHDGWWWITNGSSEAGNTGWVLVHVTPPRIRASTKRADKSGPDVTPISGPVGLRGTGDLTDQNRVALVWLFIDWFNYPPQSSPHRRTLKALDSLANGEGKRANERIQSKYSRPPDTVLLYRLCQDGDITPLAVHQIIHRHRQPDDPNSSLVTW